VRSTTFAMMSAAIARTAPGSQLVFNVWISIGL
jgi:hypothetical protein